MRLLRRPAEPDVPPFIGKIEALYQQLPGPDIAAPGADIAAPGAGAAAGEGPPPGGQAQAQGPSEGMMATLRWYYRPTELEVDQDISFESNEVFL